MNETLEPHLSHMVLKGREDWLFLANDTNRVLDQVTGTLRLSDLDIEAWRMTLDLRRAWLKDMGCKYLFAVAPAKEVVYQNHLPEGIDISKNRPVYQLKESIGSKIPFVYLDDTLSTMDSATYSKTDTHWNDYGGYAQAREILASLSKIGVELPPLSRLDIQFEEHEWYGDLGRKLTPPQMSKLLRKNGYLRQARVLPVENVQNTGSIVIFKNTDRSLPTAVMFGDSFAGVGSVADLLAQQFSTFVGLWQPHFDFKLLESIRPDVVISQMAERFLIKIPDDIKSEKLSTMSGFKAKWESLINS